MSRRTQHQRQLLPEEQPARPVRDHAQGYRRRAEQIRQARKQFKDWFKNDYRVAHSFVYGTLRRADKRKAEARALLLREVGVDPDLPCVVAPPDAIFRPDGSWVRAGKANYRLVAEAVAVYFNAKLLLEAVGPRVRIYHDLFDERTAVYAGATLIFELYETFPLVHAAMVASGKVFHPGHTAEATLKTASFLWTRISQGANPRLDTALLESGRTLEDALPAAVFEAIHGTKGDFTLDNLRGMTANIMAGQERKAEQKYDAGDDIDMTALPAIEDFTAREVARIEMQDVIERAGLTLAEREVFDLHVFQALTGSEIATRRGTAESTIHVTLNHARAKLRKTLSA